MAKINITVEFENMPDPHVDDDAIMWWIDARLNDARNLFIRSVSRKVEERGGATRLGARRWVRPKDGSPGYYKRRRKPITHVASAAGEYPATDSGRLVGSVAYQLYGPREGALYSDVEYAQFLAAGTVHMEPRRMFEDAIQQVLEQQPRGDVLARAAKVK